MNNYYLAIDIGASSGRHILGTLQNGKIKTKEIHRFKNEFLDQDGELCWDLEKLFYEIIFGIKKCRQLNKIPYSIGIDTWGVDYVLLDENDKVIGKPYSYRDKRTNGMDDKVYQYISEDALYQRNGIQKQIFNTIYQLMAAKEQHPEQFAQTKAFLMIPDYFHFLLTGQKANEYTNATTTQLVNVKTRDWDTDIIEKLGYPRQMFSKIMTPGEVLGELKDEIAEEVGFNCKVILPATHDTGSAVLAVPSEDENTLYISSGTWSLMGVERLEADCSTKSKVLNFTNEGGYNYRYRYLKNIMGLWMIQCLQKELDGVYSFAELCEMAASVEISSRVDCNASEFLAPKSMIEAIQNFCHEGNQSIPKTPGELAHVIYTSLADCYHKTVSEIEFQLGIVYDTLHIVGGGAQAEYLNQLTAQKIGKTVTAGPYEATAIGNLMVQMLTNNEWENLKEARKCVTYSFDINKFGNGD